MIRTNARLAASMWVGMIMGMAAPVHGQVSLAEVTEGVKALSAMDDPGEVHLIERWTLEGGRSSTVDQLYKLRDSNRLDIQTRLSGERVVRVSNDRYGFEARSWPESTGTWVLSGFDGGETKNSFTEGWEAFARPVIRPDCHVERWALVDLLNSQEYQIEVAGAAGGDVTLKLDARPDRANDTNAALGPHKAVVVLSPARQWAIASFDAVSAGGQKLSYAVSEWLEANNRFFPKVATWVVDKSKATRSYDVQFAPAPHEEFLLSAFNLPEPANASSLFSRPVVWLLVVAVVLFLLASGVRKARTVS